MTTTARGDLIERRLLRFHSRFQNQIRALANRHAKLADLAISFPALLFALAVPRRNFDAESIVMRVLQGARFSELSDEAGVPLWSRRLPPEAFVRPFERLPDGDGFRKQIGNFLPRSPRLAPIWLQAVADAHTWGHEQLAVWIARELCRNGRNVKLEGLRLIAIWAWFSSQKLPEDYRLSEDPWTPAMTFPVALKTSQKWRQTLELHLSLGDEPIPDMWLTPQRIDDLEFVPLRSKMDIIFEAAAMRNCLLTYGVSVARNQSRLWSIRKGGSRIATIEVARRGRDPCPKITQIRTPNNGHASEEIWWAAHRWVKAHDLACISTKPLSWREASIDRSRWLSFWRPYWLAKQRIPAWLPLSPSLSTLNEL